METMLEQQARATIDRGSKSFAAAARLFKPATRRDVMLLYTWCRHCDDLTDGQELGRGRLQTATAEALKRLRADSL
ncbi:MAG TPA: squalene/phytoene synthase family protein, partial [Wenzhouxiangellaceae bacterium]|nr:squalene/phytoene synthase family protein [Wenzhouxiangellaceae bacterium]